MRRFTQPTNGFSKKVENRANPVALHFAYYNLVNSHKTLRMTTAMGAGVTDRQREMSNLIADLEATEEVSRVPGPDEKREK